jgi:hypothetical protein
VIFATQRPPKHFEGLDKGQPLPLLCQSSASYTYATVAPAASRLPLTDAAFLSLAIAG